MTAKERVSTLKLAEKIDLQPNYAKRIGVSVELKKRVENESNHEIMKRNDRIQEA